ncbi:hypothetical protein IC582_012874 [Cucumis melo]
MKGGKFVLIFLVAFIPMIYGKNVTMGNIVVDGTTRITETDENYICMTIDYWPFNECSTIPCLWDGNASALNLNLSLPTLTKAVQGGSLQDKLIYDVGSFKGNCPQFVRNSTAMFHISEGCLSMERWDDLNQFFNKTGAIVTFGLNALLGRQHTSGLRWEGEWNYTNAEAFIQYTIEKNYRINSWEFGNEMVGHNSIGVNITSAQYAKDLIKLREIIDRLYNNSQQKPLIAAPSAFFDASWYKDFVYGTGPGIVDILTHHIYNMGAGYDPKVIDNFLDPNYLSKESRDFQQLKNIVENNAPWSVAWVGEAGGTFHGGSPYISNTFVDGFWYIDQLAMAALYNTKVYCRQTLVGGFYGILLPYILAPSPDYYGALLFHRLMGSGVLKVDNNVSFYLRTYAHCTKERSGVTMLFINLSNQTEFTIDIKNNTMNMGLPNKPSQREEYHLTPNNGLVRSSMVLLNGNLLKTTEDGDLPDLTPIYRDSNSSITVATWSIVFVVIPDFEAPACK